ncbi:MAG TPA: BREX system P-loop protein BrxC [Chloroflexia bacterium]|jgi:gas vesicle protein
MKIRDTFATAIQERIEPVVKVSDRKPNVLLGELRNLVVTPQWERHMHRVLDAYTDAADQEDEQGIGIWISGFFGSGKSLLMKVLGALLEGGEIQGKAVHEVFLDRIPLSSPDRGDLSRFLTVCRRKITTTAIGGNLHAMLADTGDSLALVTFKLFANHLGYTHNWPLAWAVEYQVDARGLSTRFRQLASELCGTDWDEISVDPEFYLDQLYQAAAQVLPDHFKDGAAAVERAVSATQQNGVTPTLLIERLRRWCEMRDGGGRRHKLLLQLDELGQWIAGGSSNERIMQVQALTESAAAHGGGRIWIAVTAHGDIQALKQNVQQEQYAKINQRFAVQCKLSNDDISLVVEERLLRKRQEARSYLTERFGERAGELTDMGTMQRPQRVYPVPDEESFALFYPFMPWTVAVIPDAVKGIAQSAGRDEALTGSNRTMIGVVQGAIIETPGLLDNPVGRVLNLADLYDQLSSDVPIETKTDLNKIIDTVPGATAFTVRVARALFLLGQAKYIPTELENVTRCVVDSLDASLAPLSKQVKSELDRLVAAGYAKQTGEQYVFLSTQQRSFQDKVRARQGELELQTYELSQALKEYESEDALRFDRVPLQGREISLKMELDGRVVRNPTSTVPLRVYSPFQRALDPQVSDDNALKQRSTQEPDAIFFRMEDVPGLRATLALALATAEVADRVIAANQASGAELDVARHAKQTDLPSHKADVRKLLGHAVKGGTIFFRGSVYQLSTGESAGAAVRATLAQLVPSIYSRFGEVPHRIVNEETAVKAALSANTSNADLKELGVFRADGTLNETNPLVSALRGRLPLAEQDQQPIPADVLRNEFERPPFGWDGNAVKVGLALLLRASACRIIDSGRVLTDPSDPEVAQMLSKEMRFKSIRVQGVRSDLGPKELQQIRGYMETIFNAKPPLVAATIHTVLGDKLMETAKQAQELKQWASTAQCPLPVEFESGSELLTELFNMSAPAGRLPRFLEQADRLLEYMELMDRLKGFQREQGALFPQVRDFFNSMVNAETALPEVNAFISDWRTLQHERKLIDPYRWQELTQAYKRAQDAVSTQVVTWREQVQDELKKLEAEIKARAEGAGVPAQSLEEDTSALREECGRLRQRLQQSSPGWNEARGWQTALSNIKLNLPIRIRELREKYNPNVVITPEEVRLRRDDLLASVRITSMEDLDGLLKGLRRRIEQELDQHRTVIIE